MTGQGGGPRYRARSVARLAAVQALYQMEAAGIGAAAVVREFHDHRFDRDMDGQTLAGADETFFAELVSGVAEGQVAVDRSVARRLSQGWRLERLDATARAILRCGAFELMERPETPIEVVIDEYMEIAKSFFSGTEPGFINAALDAVARDARAN
jgi:N utilization substance protein B